MNYYKIDYDNLENILKIEKINRMKINVKILLFY